MADKKYLFLNSRDEFFRVDISKIVYFEADGNYTHIYLSNKMKGTVCMNLINMQATLSENLREAASTFARVGKSHIINLRHVYNIAILRQKLTLSDGENFSFTISISKEALKKLRALFVGKVPKIADVAQSACRSCRSISSNSNDLELPERVGDIMFCHNFVEDKRDNVTRSYTNYNKDVNDMNKDTAQEVEVLGIMYVSPLDTDICDIITNGVRVFSVDIDADMDFVSDNK